LPLSVEEELLTDPGDAATVRRQADEDLYEGVSRLSSKKLRENLENFIIIMSWKINHGNH
jgi:hypothetical protein